ncbi:MAG TPA: DUF2807 domain-containing protein [Janthinobacterium sp.]|nr:DUF2807 domain-containing protein [Janthinobacterium sp.]
MKSLLNVVLVCLALCAFRGAAAAEDMVSETRTIDARVTRVKLDGVIELRLRQGPVPSLTIRAERRLLSRITSTQSGDTLHIESDGHGFTLGRAGARAELVLPALRGLSSDGLGGSDVSGFTGDELELSLDGAGTMKVVCDYKRLHANLGGVGNMHIWLSDNERTDLDLSGAGYIVLGGRSKALRVDLGGLGGLDARQFQADSVNLEMSGLGNASINARQNATVNLSGLGSVTVYGRPSNRNVSVDGLGRVSWK